MDTPSTYTVDDVLAYLEERAQWLDREMRHGGSLEYIKLKYEECRYIQSSIRLMRDSLIAA